METLAAIGIAVAAIIFAVWVSRRRRHKGTTIEVETSHYFPPGKLVSIAGEVFVVTNRPNGHTITVKPYRPWWKL